MFRLKSPLNHALIVAGYLCLYALYFSPIIFGRRVLAPEDASLFYLPSYLSAHGLWDPNIWLGHPVFADQQMTTWYPPAMILSRIPGTWNLYVVAAYWLASAGTYGYVYQLTRGRFPAFLAGAVYGLSGFMVSHLAHTTMIHGAAWLPLVIWSLESLSERLSAKWFAVGTLSVACAAFAGHPQILTYTMSLAGVYALAAGWRVADWRRRFRYWGVCALIVILAVGIFAVQLLPAAELAREAWRARPSFAESVTYSLPPNQIPTLVFPYLYGGAPRSIYGDVPYFGEWPSNAYGWGVKEVAGYVGLLPLLLAGCAIVARPRRLRRVIYFWLGAGAFAFALALGDATPLAALAFEAPFVKFFRAPARHFFEVSFAVSVLAGCGAQSLRRESFSRREVCAVVAGAACALAVCCAAIFFSRDRLKSLAATRVGLENLSLSPLSNAAVAAPPLLFALSCVALIYFHRRGRGAAVLLFAAAALDLASFGWFCEWRFISPRTDYLAPAASAVRYGEKLAASGQRVAPVRGALGTQSEMPPNISSHWNVASVGGYGPLISARLRDFLEMQPHGSIDAALWRGDAASDAHRGLDLASARYLLTPAGEPAIAPRAKRPQPRLETVAAKGVEWAAADADRALGNACGAPNPSRLLLELPRPRRIAAVGLVSSLACAAGAAQGAEIGRVRLLDENGASVATQSILAGRDSSEWSFDCADVRPLVRHGRAEIFKSASTLRNDRACDAHQYVSFIKFERSDREIKSVAIEWVGAGDLVVQKVSLIADESSGGEASDAAARSTPLAIDAAGGAEERWRFVERIDEADVYENLRALPRARLVSRALRLAPEEILRAVQSSRLPDGSAYDPRRLALIEEAVPDADAAPPAGGAPAAFDDSGAVVTRTSNAEVEVRTRATAPAFLVLSDAYYPGWVAEIDGSPTKIYRADYLLRGVAIPAGEHVVRFSFRPRSLRYGAAISLLSLTLLAALTWIGWKSNRRVV